MWVSRSGERERQTEKQRDASSAAIMHLYTLTSSRFTMITALYIFLDEVKPLPDEQRAHSA